MFHLNALNRNPLRLWRACTGVLLALAASPTLLMAANAPAQAAAQTAEWTPSANGQWLLQRSTGLLWQRCVMGMHWNGKDCAGQPLWVDHIQASAMAREQARADQQPWRLPRLRELQQLAKMGAQAPSSLLPESTQGWVWTATIPIDIRKVNPFSYASVVSGSASQSVTEMSFLYAWVVNTATGESRDDVLKRTPLFVRLVRKSGEP